MLPSFANQPINSRFMDEVWKLGLDMKDLYDIKITEKMVNELLVEKRKEFMKSADLMANFARKNVNEGGSSYGSLDHMINDIKMMSSKPENS